MDVEMGILLVDEEIQEWKMGGDISSTLDAVWIC
jgi:hypothetical protein